MTLYIRTAVGEEQCLFYVFDHKEELLWKVHLTDGTPGKMRILHPDGQTLLTVQPALVSFCPKFHLSIAGLERVRVAYKQGLSHNPTLAGTGWVLSGEVCTGAYSVHDRAGNPVFNHQKKWGPGGEYAELEVPLSEHFLLSAGIVVTIDQTMTATPQPQPV